jgi:hypothetical protein
MNAHVEIRRALSSIALLVAVADLGGAQVPNASPAATGLSGAFTARARGYDAIAWNPANLGLRDNPRFSFSLLAISGSSGLAPITLADIAQYSGKTLPRETREKWLQTVTSEGGESGSAEGGVTLVALSAGPFAFEVAGSAAGSTNMNAGAFEALMFGNAGLTGLPRDLDIDGSSGRVAAFTTAAASYGLSLGPLALGVTGKYVLGNAFAMAQDQGSVVALDSMRVNFPVVYSWADSNAIAGMGVGLDVGLSYAVGRFAFGATVQNAANGFTWDETKLRSKAATALLNGVDDSVSFEDRPYAEAPAALRARVANDRFNPIVAVGLAYGLGSPLVVSIDARQQTGDGILIGPTRRISGGLDARIASVLHLRGGGSYITDGWGASGGLGVDIGSFELGVGGALRTVNGARVPAVTINLLSLR